MSEPQGGIRILDASAPEDTVGKDAWYMTSWCYEDDLPPEPVGLAVRNALGAATFAQEITLLAEHFNRPVPSAPLLQRYYRTVSAALSEEQFLSAVQAAYAADLYWAQLVPFLVAHPTSLQMAAHEAYQPFSLREAADLLNQVGFKMRKMP